MKTTVFARPNLKMFLLCALLIAALQHLLSASDSSTFNLAGGAGYVEGGPAQSVVDDLVDHSLEHPTIENFMLISDIYRQRGDTRQAMSYIRKARLAAEIDGE